MQLDIYFLAIDDVKIEWLKNEEDFIKQYVTDEDGRLSFESLRLDSLKEVDLLTAFLFDNNSSTVELYNDLHTRIIDITHLKNNLITIDKLDSGYPGWLERTKRENTMDEYGMLICAIGFIQENIAKKYLLLIIRNE